MKLFCTLLVTITIVLSHTFSTIYCAHGDSPSFTLQGIENIRHHWHLENNGIFFGQNSAKNITECSTRRGHFPFPQIAAVNYISNGKNLNATIWLDSPFQQPTASATPKRFLCFTRLYMTNDSIRQLRNISLKRVLESILS
jgi:hypothetical protein